MLDLNNDLQTSNKTNDNLRAARRLGKLSMALWAVAIGGIAVSFTLFMFANLGPSLGESADTVHALMGAGFVTVFLTGCACFFAYYAGVESDNASRRR